MLAVGLIAAPVLAVPTLTTLVTFDGSNGWQPIAGLVADSAGNLYGATAAGSPSGRIFELATGTHTYTQLKAFTSATADGRLTAATLAIDSAGNLYGTTVLGGTQISGNVFKLAATTHAFSVLTNFRPTTDGTGPSCTPIVDSSGNLFGTTSGLATNFVGTIWELPAATPNVTTLLTFGGPNGKSPGAGLVGNPTGTMFGTLYSGGTNNDGSVFQFSGGNLATIATFDGSNGANPQANLLVDANGNLYGTTKNGGTANDGTIFEIVAGSNTITALSNFNGANGANPQSSLIFDANGNLWGTAQNGGANNNGDIFEFVTATQTLNTIFSFNSTNGAMPLSELTYDKSGNLYGTTFAGGAHNDGTVYELSNTGFVAPVPEPASVFVVGILVGGLLMRRRALC